ncbi:hypothetical protein QQS_3966, partial [Clostridioides difficile P6]
MLVIEQITGHKGSVLGKAFAGFHRVKPLPVHAPNLLGGRGFLDVLVTAPGVGRDGQAAHHHHSAQGSCQNRKAL